MANSHAKTRRREGVFLVLRVLASSREPLPTPVHNLDSCEAIIAGEERAGPIALLSRPERFHWLAAPRSDVLQPSPVEHRSVADPDSFLQELFVERVRPPPRG